MKYIIKKWFEGQWMIMAPDHMNRALCLTFQDAINAMDVHATTGSFVAYDYAQEPPC